MPQPPQPPPHAGTHHLYLHPCPASLPARRHRPHAVAVTVAGCRYNYRDYLGDKSRVQPGQSRDYELSVFAVDAAGNAGPPAVFRWALDRRTPTTRLTVVPGDPSRVNANITFHWLSDEGGARRK